MRVIAVGSALSMAILASPAQAESWLIIPPAPPVVAGVVVPLPPIVVAFPGPGLGGAHGTQGRADVDVDRDRSRVPGQVVVR